MARKAMVIRNQGELKFPGRRTNRCRICGRPRGYLRRFEMCRVCFRSLALRGEIPGVIKAASVSFPKIQVAEFRMETGTHF